MTTLESTGTSTGIKEQYEKHKKFVGRSFFIFLLPAKRKNKGEEELR